MSSVTITIDATRCNKNNVIITLPPSTISITYIISQIENYIGLLHPQYYLFYNMIQLDTTKTIVDYGIDNGSTITLLPPMVSPLLTKTGTPWVYIGVIIGLSILLFLTLVFLIIVMCINNNTNTTCCKQLHYSDKNSIPY